METASSGSNGEGKPVCQCATKSGVQRWLPGFPIALCLLMSLSSVTVCLLMSFRIHRLENRLHMEMDKGIIQHAPRGSFKNEDGTLISELSAPVGKMVEEVHYQNRLFFKNACVGVDFCGIEHSKETARVTGSRCTYQLSIDENMSI